MAAPVARAGDVPPPTLRSFAGAFFTEDHGHDFLVESELVLPLVREGKFGVSYRYRETTPFLDVNGPQVEVLFSRFELQADLQLTPHLRLIGVAGYHQSQNIDRHGFIGGQILGLGIGSTPGSSADRLEWHVIVGEYLTRRNLSEDWWGEAHASWRVWQWDWSPYLESQYRPAIVLNADVDSSNDGGRFAAQYRIGPALRLLSANQNYVDIGLNWYRNDGNPFYGSNEDGLLGGFNFTSGPELTTGTDVRARRADGLLPLVWGEYDVAVGGDRQTQRLQMNVEMFDVRLFDHRFTGCLSYETRQKYRPGDFDNIAYTVTIGSQTDIGLASPLSHGDPLVFGVEFLHRSDHSLNPADARVQSDGKPAVFDGTTVDLLEHGFLNVMRLRLQSKGWDLPYRDPSIYERKTEWLNIVDWRLTAGVVSTALPKRGSFTGQLGVNWDIATISGYVVYARGIGSLGSETPDWQGEVGVRRPAGQVFARYDSYHMLSSIAHGNTFVVGIGVNL